MFYLPDFRHKFSSDNYYKSCKAIINKVNSHFGWNVDFFQPELYEKHHDQIVQILIDNYTIRNTDMLTSKMGHIYGVMKVVGYKGTFTDRALALRQIPIIPNPLIKNTPDWNEMVSRINKAISEANHTGAIVIGITYRHGYVLRCGEIANTCTKRVDGYNFLDMEGLRWWICADQTKNSKDRSFPVTEEYIKELRPYIKATGWLVSKKNGQPYTGNFTLSTVGLLGLNVNEIRNAYETMNYSRTDIDDTEKARISEDVLGHCVAVARAFYTPPINIHQ